MFIYKKLYPAFLCWCLFIFSCTDFEYSPNQAFDKDSPTNLNDVNLSRLQNINNDDTLRFIVFGDPQKSANELDLFVRKANTMRGIDLIFVAGDLSEFGLLQETEWVAGQMEKLKAPHFAVIGNHDLLANGDALFKRMFGKLDYSFVYDGVKFICHNTNGREYKFNGKVPDINWVKNELSSSANINSYIGISHMRPFSADFDAKLDTTYTNVLNAQPQFLASFHGHDHGWGEFYPNNSRVPFVVTTNIGSKGFILAEIINQKISYERVEF